MIVYTHNPVMDVDSSWNKGQEPFFEFIEHFCLDKKFRASRSQHVLWPYYVDEDGYLAPCHEYQMDEDEVVNWLFGDFDMYKAFQYFTPSIIKNKHEYIERDYIKTTENIMQFSVAYFFHDGCGQTLSYIFMRKSGKWYWVGGFDVG